MREASLLIVRWRLATVLAGVISIGFPIAAMAADGQLATEKLQKAAVKCQKLIAQVTAPVRWEESILHLQQGGITHALELGAGAVLRGLVKRIAPGIAVQSVGEPADLAAANLGGGEA